MTVFGGLVPSSTSQRTQTYRMLSYKYGNGYEQRAADGINPLVDTQTINFDNLTPANCTILEAWLATVPPWVTFHGDGVALNSSLTYWITKDGWQKTVQPGGVCAYQFNVEQVY